MIDYNGLKTLPSYKDTPLYLEWMTSASDFKQKYWRPNTNYIKALADVHRDAEEELETDHNNLGVESLELVGLLRGSCRGRTPILATRQTWPDIIGHTGNRTANGQYNKDLQGMTVVQKKVLAAQRHPLSGNRLPLQAQPSRGHSVKLASMGRTLQGMVHDLPTTDHKRFTGTVSSSRSKIKTRFPATTASPMADCGGRRPATS